MNRWCITLYMVFGALQDGRLFLLSLRLSISLFIYSYTCVMFSSYMVFYGKRWIERAPIALTATIQYVMNRLSQCHFNASVKKRARTSKSPSYWRRDRGRKRRKKTYSTYNTHIAYTLPMYVWRRRVVLWTRVKRKNSLTLSHSMEMKTQCNTNVNIIWQRWDIIVFLCRIICLKHRKRLEVEWFIKRLRK